MKCPKCHYVSFDGQQRCRNCGYDFSLSVPAEPADLTLRPAPPATGGGPGVTPGAPGGAASSGTHGTPMDPSPTGRARISGAYEPPAPRRTGDLPPRMADTGTRPRMQDTGRPRQADDGLRLQTEEPGRGRTTDSDPLDLPLFDPGVPLPADDRPLVSATLPPRPPLSVRRTSDTGTRPRPRVTPQPPGTTTTASLPPSARPTPPLRQDEPRLDLDFSGGDALDVEPDLSLLGAESAADSTTTTTTGTRIRTGRVAAAPASGATARAAANDAALTDAADAAIAGAADETDAAPLGPRITAGAIDVAFLLFIDLIVLHFTFRLTGLPFGSWGRLPLAPLIGFLGLLHGGYLAMFIAASGQTMGKMVAGVKVVTTSGGPVPFGQAVLRACVWLIGVPTLVGLVPALLSADRRALHDRFADTKVIKVD